MASTSSHVLSAVPSEPPPPPSAGGTSSYLVFAAEEGIGNVCDGRRFEYLTAINGLELESSPIGAYQEDESSSSVSSLVAAVEEEEGEEEVQKSGTTVKKVEPLGSLNSLEDSLPIKRGLSNFYTGKSRSFASLSESAAAAAARELAKPENPFNKRRRILMYSWQRTASCSSLLMSSLPPLPTHDLSSLEESEEEEDEEGGERSELSPLPSSSHGGRTMVNDRSFSLGDLQQHANVSS